MIRFLRQCSPFRAIAHLLLLDTRMTNRIAQALLVLDAMIRGPP